MRIAIIGFGLIGGSIARALARAPDAAAWEIAAWSPTGDGPRAAAADGVIDRAAESPLDALTGSDLVVLAAPPTACLEALDHLAGPWADALRDGAVVTDVASTKGAIVDHATTLGIRFVGGHPMAGLETSGYGSSTAELFAGRPWVVVAGETADAAAILAVETLAVSCAARAVRLDAAAHDAAVAAISHLPLILSVALVEAVAGGTAGPRADWPVARNLAAGGWRDATRLARGDVAMGAGIAATNATELAARIRDARAVLDAWLADLEGPSGPDEAAIAARLRTARARLEEET